MPIDRLLEIDRMNIVLIGDSGCGKTRTCYDLCRYRWGILFDCVSDADFLALVSFLVPKCPRIKSKASQNIFEDEFERLIQCLLSARLFVLKTLLGNNTKLSHFDWFCVQRSRRSISLFSTIFAELCTLDWSVSFIIFSNLKNWFCQMNGRIIFDESQRLLNVLEVIDPHVNQRSRMMALLFLLDLSFIFSRDLLLRMHFEIYGAAHMRIRNLELMRSAAGSKQNDIVTFSDFTYLRPEDIFKLLHKWLRVDHAEYTILFEEISMLLQGRPRLLISFLHKLIDSSDIDSSFRSYLSAMTTNVDPGTNASFYFFWENRFDWTIQPIDSKTACESTKQVSETLLKLCTAFLFGDGTSIYIYIYLFRSQIRNWCRQIL